MEETDINRWSSYNQMIKKNETNKKVKINNWIDYFNYINLKLNIEVSEEMKMDLIQNDIKRDILQNLQSNNKI